MANGVGGSYTKWQSKPPEHTVVMVLHEDGDDVDCEGEWTTVKAYNLLDREIHEDSLKIENGATGPSNTPFKHDVDFENLPSEKQEEIKEYIISEFEDT